MTEPQREQLAEAQAELLRALLAGGPTPSGFDPERLRVEADALLAKRRRVVAMLEPDARAELDDDFVQLFNEYARTNPRQVGTRAREDAAGFVEWARGQGRLERPRTRWWTFRRATGNGR
ncbi:hypothetical protein [Actinocrispum wychmicini]|uniref:SCO6045-like C-terminal domain-containing protein n=1 Tax=Actinocrispum wychmicini TaxID=1213861 RepID=A0A4R2J431_9PSEU|nr:hypothetical protein [Actinocrispum wychmicini]TCO52457.1 hypothetical protein EV192_112189 [Actinocrispum wychmicini]